MPRACTKRRRRRCPEGDWAAPPVTAQLPDGSGYGYIAARNRAGGTAGMVLQTDRRATAARLAHSAPASYPYRLRYPATLGEAQRWSPRAKRPARSPTPSARDTRWFRPEHAGRQRYHFEPVSTARSRDLPARHRHPVIKPSRRGILDGGENAFEGIKDSDMAGKLGVRVPGGRRPVAPLDGRSASRPSSCSREQKKSLGILLSYHRPRHPGSRRTQRVQRLHLVRSRGRQD